MATPRPRPRPRPAPKAAPAAKSKSGSTSRDQEQEEEDKMFIRNQNRTAEQWKKLRQNFKDEPIVVHSSDEEEPSTQTDRKRQKKPQSKTIAKGWQNDTNINRYLSQEVSSGGESDEIQIVGGPSQKPATRRVSPGKRKRSKSRSLTPPPEASAYAIAFARNVVRQAFNETERKRSVSPITCGDLSDDVISDPELQKIAQQAKQKLKATDRNEGATGAVLIKVTWTPYPQGKNAAQQQWAFKMNKKDSFREMFEFVASKTFNKVVDLCVTYKDRRVYPSSTPDFLKMSNEEEELDMCDQRTYDYLKQQKRAHSLIDSDAEEEAPAQSSINSDDESEAGVEKLSIILRSSKATKDIPLKVKSTTTCQAIVAAFAKQAGISGDVSKGRISVDGEKLDPSSSIGEADVEDGDMIEVVGL